MIKKLILLFSILLLPQLAFSDEAADKAEFKRLYAEFNELYAHSEDLDPIIDVAEKLYEIAPKAYGENHANTAVVTYNLASLYVEKSEISGFSHLNTNAAELFKDYFEYLDDTNAPQDRNYVYQYLQYIKAMTSQGRSKSVKSHTKKCEE